MASLGNIFKKGQKIPDGERKREQKEREKQKRQHQGQRRRRRYLLEQIFPAAHDGPTPEIIFLTGTAACGEPTLERRKSTRKK